MYIYIYIDQYTPSTNMFEHEHGANGTYITSISLAHTQMSSVQNPSPIPLDRWV